MTALRTGFVIFTRRFLPTGNSYTVLPITRWRMSFPAYDLSSRAPFDMGVSISFAAGQLAIAFHIIEKLRPRVVDQEIQAARVPLLDFTLSA